MPRIGEWVATACLLIGVTHNIRAGYPDVTAISPKENFDNSRQRMQYRATLSNLEVIPIRG
jgi:hypothetical protein